LLYTGNFNSSAVRCHGVKQVQPYQFQAAGVPKHAKHLRNSPTSFPHYHQKAQRSLMADYDRRNGGHRGGYNNRKRRYRGKVFEKA